ELKLLDGGVTPPGLATRMKARMASVETALDFERLLASIKNGKWLDTIRIGLARPRTLALLRLPLAARLERLFSRPAAHVEKPSRAQICLLSRQRVVGRTNGSSTYLLDLAEAIGRRGMELSFLSPSPTTLGRWPYLRLSGELSIFRRVQVRG